MAVKYALVASALRPIDCSAVPKPFTYLASLGLSSDLGVYLPFGSLAYHLVQGVKADDKSELVVIPGTNLWTKPQHPKKTTP